MAEVDVSVIVPVLNRADLVLGFWSRLHSHRSYELILVDNGSAEGTTRVLRLLQQRDEHVLVLRNNVNTGFGPASNQGAETATGRVLLFTQPDVIFSGDVIERVSELSSDALYGARLLTYDTGWNKFKSVIVQYLEGWLLACTRSCWGVLGGFDPRYVPADFEDIDLSYTATSKGILLKQMDVPAKHPVMGQSAWTQFPDRAAVTVRNQALFREKWGL